MDLRWNSGNGYAATIAPIDIAGERLGTLFVYRQNAQFDIDDIIPVRIWHHGRRFGDDAFRK